MTIFLKNRANKKTKLLKQDNQLVTRQKLRPAHNTDNKGKLFVMLFA